MTTLEGNDLTAARRSTSKNNIIDVKGKITAQAETVHYSIPVEEPHLYTAHVFRNILRKAGVAFEGKVGSKGTPQDASLLGTHSSRPLCQMVEEMMKTSNNFIADSLFKKLGAERLGLRAHGKKGRKRCVNF